VLFAVRYAGYVLFYGPFGVGPADVGLGWSQALVETILATTVWAIAGGVLCALGLLVAAALLLVILIILIALLPIVATLDVGVKAGLAMIRVAFDLAVIIRRGDTKARFEWPPSISEFFDEPLERLRTMLIAGLMPGFKLLWDLRTMAAIGGAGAALVILQLFSLIGGPILGHRAHDGHP
jgi:hypothetical protein